MLSTQYNYAIFQFQSFNKYVQYGHISKTSFHGWKHL